MIYLLDAAYPPSAVQARRQFDLGWRGFGGYIGGPRAAHTWTRDDFARVAGEGFRFLPIYVGRTSPWDGAAAFSWDQGWTDGIEAHTLARGVGFVGSELLVLDAEYGDFQAEPQAFEQYLGGWVAAVNAAGRQACLYSDPQTIAVLGAPELVDWTWAASYVVDGRKYQRAPEGQFDPAAPPPWSAWQFAGGATIAGLAVDLSSALEDLPLAALG
jgi:hypothetical protein